MARDTNSKCKKCRRAGDKLFLKGSRCESAKCAMVKKPYPPGEHTRANVKGLSEYGKQLAMKQKIKRTYGVLERQFRKYFEEIKNKPGVTGDLLMAKLEKRLDNAVFRMGVANSRSQARQLVGHGEISVNGKRVDIPSYEVKIGDVITINEAKKDKNYFKNQAEVLKNKKNFPSWMQVNASNMEAKIVAVPQRGEIEGNMDPQIVVEYYSR